MAEHFGVEPDALRAVSTCAGELGSRASGAISAAPAQIAAQGRACGGGVLGSLRAKTALLDYDAQRLRYPCGRFEVIRPGLGLGHLINGSQLVTGLSPGCCVSSMRDSDDDGDVVAALTVRMS